MELDGNGNGSDNKPEDTRSKPFDIDLNETPLSSPDETVPGGPPADVISPSTLDGHSGEGIRAGGSDIGLLDINALPPVEEGSSELMNSGVQTAFDTSLVPNSNIARATHSNFLYAGSHLDRLKASDSVTDLVKSGFEDIVQQRLNFGRSLTETDQGSLIRERIWSSGTTIHRTSCQKYRALDPNKFDSVFDVACHLGLVSNNHSVESEDRSDGFALVQKGLHLHHSRKESLMFSRVNNLEECQENLGRSFGGGFSLRTETAESQACKLKNNLHITQANSNENSGCHFSQSKVGLPVQFEDFCLLAVGEVDPRPSYHNNSQIWPIGYRSSWHDKITGSLFICDVSNGGDFGPLFKVKRYPCSAQPIPCGSTVLLRPSTDLQDGKGQVETDDLGSLNDDDYANVQMIFADESPPHLEYDNLSNSGKDSDEAHNSKTINSLQAKSNLSLSPGRSTSNYIELEDDIGEFLVEGRSSSSVWRMVSQTLVHACHKAYGQTGACKFYCKHDVIRMWSSCFDSIGEEATESSDSLAKFCCLSGPINIPHHIRSSDALDTSSEALMKWLDQDRFGLDVEFVQEIMEHLLQVHACAEYILLNKRRDGSVLQTVGSGYLLVKRNSDIHEKEANSKLVKGSKGVREQVVKTSVIKTFPPGKPLSSKLPTELIGDVLQSWELLWRFSEVLGLKEPLSFKELEEELLNGNSINLKSSSTSNILQGNEHAFIAVETECLKEATPLREASNTNSGCTGVAPANFLCSLLNILLGELQFKVAAFIDSNFDSGESKSRRRRKKDADNVISGKRIMLDLLPINGLTWPELARRYVLTVSSMDGNLDSVDYMNRENCKAFHCLQGDSGTIHGSLPGVAGMEANALLLAEASKKIFGSLKNTSDVLSTDCNESDPISAHETVMVNDGGIPEWARVLEPVRKLPTNVGARIRKCVYDALEKGPPDWAKKRLEHSISKEVYKGNASGPTKKAVLSVLAEACGENQPQKPTRKRRNRSFNSVSDVIMKQCRKVLRCAAAADEEKVFCNLLGRTLLNTSENDDEGLLGFPAMVSRPLDFRTIDLRLAFGAYGGSHEAFLEDVREVWHQIRTAYGDQSDLLGLADKLSQNFEELYEKEVLTLAQKFSDYPNMECLNSESKKEMDDVLESVGEIPKAPWDEGVCKVCGIDKDDDNVLLCDTCDSGYHTYCLNPPLARVPEGNWYCPLCVSGNCNNQYTSQVPQVINRSQRRRYHGELTRGFLESLSHLAMTMEIRDYWDYSSRERIFLLKFLCDELLNSASIREHLENCASVSGDLQQKLRSLSLEWKNLKYKEEILAGKLARVNTNVLGGVGKSNTEGVSTPHTSYGKLLRQPPNENGYFSSIPADFVLSEDRLQLQGTADFRKQPCWFYPKGISVRQPSFCGNQIGKATCTEVQVLQQSDKDNVLRTESPHNRVPLSAPQQQKNGSTGEYTGQGNCDRGQELENSICGLGLANCGVQQDHVSSDPVRSPVADHMHTLDMSSENQFPDHYNTVQHDMNESEPHDIKGNLLKNEIAILQDSIACLESQLQIVSLRKELLGRDSSGRLYWAFSRPCTAPWLLVDGSTMLQQKGLVKELENSLANNFNLRYSSSFETENNSVPTFSSWFSYQSDVEIEELIEWLTNSDPRDKELAESILRWQKIGYKDFNKAGNKVEDESLPSSSKSISSEATLNSTGLVTKALILLEKKHGPCLEPEASEILMTWDQDAELIRRERMYRCECLEPVWPSRFHCCQCHLSFSCRSELKEHNDGMCNPGAISSQSKKADGEGTRGKGTRRTETLQGDCVGKVGKGMSGSVKHEKGFGLFELPKELACPYDIEEISAKFVTKNSIKELVQEIGLIGLDGIPSFVSTSSPYLSDPSLKLVHLYKNENNKSQRSTNVENQLQYSVQENFNSCVKHSNVSNNSIRRCVVSANDEEVLKSRRLNSNFMSEKRDQSSSRFRSPKMGIANCSIIHDSSSRPLTGRGVQILRQLKINLLDMDAAVPEEALRSSKACWGKRCAWRTFVKSAKSIFEMVQATIVFEDMIKTDYLRNGWWYWSSLSAAAKIATVSSLALRLYTLDAAIVYEKPCATSASTETLEHGSKSDKDVSPSKDSTSNNKPSKPVQKTPNLDLIDFPKPRTRSVKKRKDLGG